MNESDWSLSFTDHSRDECARLRKEAVREAVRKSEAAPRPHSAPEATPAQREKYRSQIRKAVQDAQCRAARFAFPD